MTVDPPFNVEEVDRLLTTTKAVRRRLDLTRPVARHVIVDCIRLASYAPNASNGQEWRWVVVDDPGLRAQVGDLYRRMTEPGVSRIVAAKEAAGDAAGVRISRSVLYLAEKMAEVPVIVLACYDVAGAAERYGRLIGPGPLTTMHPSMFASILPAVWSFQLALRSRGLGSTLTTAHQSDQPAMAKILGIPESWYQVLAARLRTPSFGTTSPDDYREK
jgi:nitroreductase